MVLIHGGAHSADCWDLTTRQLEAQEPRLQVLAVELPGRGNSAAALASVTVADFVDSVVDAGRDSRFDDVIVVGHSMAGLTLPGVAEDLGAGYLGAPVPSTIVPSFMATAKSAMFPSILTLTGMPPSRRRTLRQPSALAADSTQQPLINA